MTHNGEMDNMTDETCGYIFHGTLSSVMTHHFYSIVWAYCHSVLERKTESILLYNTSHILLKQKIEPASGNKMKRRPDKYV